MHTSRPATLLLLALSGAASLATSSNSISTVEDSGPSWVASGSTTTTTGLRLLNPGSPTDRRRQPHCTYMTLTLESGELRDLTLHRLPPRR